MLWRDLGLGKGVCLSSRCVVREDTSDNLEFTKKAFSPMVQLCTYRITDDSYFNRGSYSGIITGRSYFNSWSYFEGWCMLLVISYWNYLLLLVIGNSVLVASILIILIW